MFWFALKTLLTDRGKALTALVGVVFSLVLVDIQGGLYFGLIRKASLLTDHCDADLWVAHRRVENVDFAQNIPEARINRIKGLPGIESAEPYLVAKGIATLHDGGYEDVWIIGADPGSMLGSGWSFVEGSRDDLLRPDSISIDELDARKLGDPQTGDVLEVNGRRAKVVAKTHGVLGFMTTPYLFATIDNARLLSGTPHSSCSYFLVRAEPGADVASLRMAIGRQLPEMDVYTAAEFGRLSQDYFLQRTGIGISFGAATLLGLLVGLMMVGQSLYALALDHLTDYATLKAIGAEDRQVAAVVTTQAMSVAALGSVIGIALVLTMQRTMSTPVSPIEIPIELLIGGVVVVFGICLMSTILPAARIRRVDPAIVLQG
jgi:putative ABC transport system permease protein